MHLPDWVLMDIKMEKMDGITATKEIKLFDKDAKIIIVTLFDDKSTKENAITAGAYKIVVKSDLTKIGEMISEIWVSRYEYQDMSIKIWVSRYEMWDKERT